MMVMMRVMMMVMVMMMVVTMMMNLKYDAGDEVTVKVFDIYCQHFSGDELRYFPTSNISILILTMNCGGICKGKSKAAVTYSRCRMDLWAPLDTAKILTD